MTSGRTPAPAPAVAHIAPRPPGQAWVLRRWDRHEDGIGLFTDEDCALAELARHVRGSWENLLGDDDFPDTPPTDRTAVDLYYGPDRDNRPDEGYSLYADTISGRGRPRIVSLAFQFPDAADCERANRDAARHAAECLTDPVHVIATGNLALRDNLLHLDSAQVGVDLAHHVAYIDDTLPAVLAGRAPAPTLRPAAAPVPPPGHRAAPSWPPRRRRTGGGPRRGLLGRGSAQLPAMKGTL